MSIMEGSPVPTVSTVEMSRSWLLGDNDDDSLSYDRMSSAHDHSDSPEQDTDDSSHYNIYNYMIVTDHQSSDAETDSVEDIFITGTMASHVNDVRSAAFDAVVEDPDVNYEDSHEAVHSDSEAMELYLARHSDIEIPPEFADMEYNREEAYGPRIFKEDSQYKTENPDIDDNSENLECTDGDNMNNETRAEGDGGNDDVQPTAGLHQLEENVDGSIESVDIDANNYEPAWTKAVGEQGDLFYLQAEESIQYVQSQTIDKKSEQNGIPFVDNTDKSKKTKKKNKSKDVKLTDNNLNHVNSSKVTFNDVPTGVTRDLIVFVDPNRNNYGRRASLCESLFGIIPGHFHTPSQEMTDPRYSNKDRRIMVQGLLPGGEAVRAGVKIGEWLMAVNELEVHYDNIDNILGSISGPRQVKLTLQKIAIQTSPKHVLMKKNCINTKLVKLISGERLHEEPMRIHTLPHSLMYLTIECDSENMKDKDDVLYHFPRVDSKLLQVRGAFITLSHMLKDVTDNTAKNSTLLCGDQLVHLGYQNENKEVMILAVPATRLSLVQLNHLLDDVVRILRLLFGSLHSAFTTPEHRVRLDHLFALVFQRALLAEDMLKRGTKHTSLIEPLISVVMGVRALTMPEETKVTMNNCLSELEAADFVDMSEDFYSLRRSYVILGSSLFYKGYLLANHLHKEDLTDISVYLHYYCLLTLCNEEQLGQLVVWREVFPTRRCHQKLDPPVFAYSEPDARWFLMIIGMRNAMLGVLLEAGGCAAWAEGHPTPDPFYVDQARATIAQMEALDVFNQCEIRLQGPAMPSVACVDWFLPMPKGSKSDDSGTSKVVNSTKPPIATPLKKVVQPESILKKRSTPSPQVETHRIGRGAIYDMDSDVDSISTGTSEGSTPIMDRRGRKASAGSDESAESQGSSSLFRGGRRKRNLLSVFDMGDLRRGLGFGDFNVEEPEPGSLVKLTTGCDNTLFHYVHVDELEGVLLCPTQQELVHISTTLHTQVLTNFHNACLIIKKAFEHSAKIKSQSERKEKSKFGVDSSLSGMLEQGMLFHCTPDNWTDSKKPPPTLTYWVVGRQMYDPFPRQFFVCFHDSAQQNLIEMAFKLGFGITI